MAGDLYVRNQEVDDELAGCRLPDISVHIGRTNSYRVGAVRKRRFKSRAASLKIIAVYFTLHRNKGEKISDGKIDRCTVRRTCGCFDIHYRRGRVADRDGKIG